MMMTVISVWMADGTRFAKLIDVSPYSVRAYVNFCPRFFVVSLYTPTRYGKVKGRMSFIGFSWGLSIAFLMGCRYNMSMTTNKGKQMINGRTVILCGQFSACANAIFNSRQWMYNAKRECIGAKYNLLFDELCERFPDCRRIDYVGDKVPMIGYGLFGADDDGNIVSIHECWDSSD